MMIIITKAEAESPDLSLTCTDGTDKTNERQADLVRKCKTGDCVIRSLGMVGRTAGGQLVVAGLH